MACRSLAFFSMLLASSAAFACRPIPLSKSAIHGAEAIAIGTITSVAHPELEAQLLSGSAQVWPGYALDPYKVRLVVTEVLIGKASGVIETQVGGCPPPWVPGEIAVIIFRSGEQPKLWRYTVVGSRIRAIVLGDES